VRLQDFAKAGADMYTFHIESVLPGGGINGLSPDQAHPEITELIALIRQAGMYVGITLKPETPVELLFPYVTAGLVDMVRS
jgi:ribulose-phosphate 3-epimerase